MFRDAVISILAVIAKQERVRLSERTLAGLARARAQGRVGGRPRVTCDVRKIHRLRASGKSLAAIAKECRLSKTTVARLISENGSTSFNTSECGYKHLEVAEVYPNRKRGR
jgi:DNA invertase Pin-like site-specific DNA recombinase